MSSEVTLSGGKDVKAFIEKSAEAIRQALPKHIDPDRMLRVLVSSIAKTPALAKCTQTSLFNAIIQIAQLGLEPNTPLQHAYIIPYKDQAEAQVGYRGLIDLARRSGELNLIYAEIVREKDYFLCERGLDPKLEHRPEIFKPRGEVIGAYAVVHLANGSKDFEPMTKAEIDAIKMRSPSVKGGKSSPWDTDYTEMAKKTVIKRICKRCPMTPELASAIELDNRQYGDLNFDAIEIKSDEPMPMPKAKSEPKNVTPEEGMMTAEQIDRAPLGSALISGMKKAAKAAGITDNELAEFCYSHFGAETPDKVSSKDLPAVSQWIEDQKKAAAEK